MENLNIPALQPAAFPYSSASTDLHAFAQMGPDQF